MSKIDQAGYESAFLDGVMTERQRIIELIQETYSVPEMGEYGSLEWTADIVALIERESK